MGQTMQSDEPLFDEIHGFLERQECHRSIRMQELRTFLQRVQAGYNELPYHGLEHVASVVRASIDMWERRGLSEAVRAAKSHQHDTLAVAFVTAAAVHDLEHQGLGNAFLVTSGHDFAIRHNDVSPNESHHLATAFELLRHHNFLSEWPRASFRLFRETVLKLVMCTDMTAHHSVAAALAAHTDSISCDTPLLMAVALKCADLTHIFLDPEAQTEWAHRLHQERRHEARAWKTIGLPPPTDLVADTAVDFATSQIVFLRSIVIPFAELVEAVLPKTASMLHAARHNSGVWRDRIYDARHNSRSESVATWYKYE